MPRPAPHSRYDADMTTPSAPPHDDRYLVLRAQDGDIVAFEKLVDRYQGRLFRSAYMIVRNRQDSEDIVQETLIQAWRSIHLVRQPDAYRGWLVRICTTKANILMSKPHRRATAPYDAESLETASNTAQASANNTADPADSSEVNAQIKALADILASVPPNLRIVWVLREIDEMTYEEIGQTLNLTVPTGRGRLARARSLVMSMMKEWS